MSDEIKKQFDAFYLFVRTDEKYEEVDAEVHDMKLEVEHLKNGLEAVESRVNMGVAVTGQNNSKAIADHLVRIATLDQRLSLVETTMKDFIEEERGSRKEIKEAVAVLYKGIVGIFFTLLCGGGVLYALKIIHFR